MGHISINDDLAAELTAYAKAQGLSADEQAEAWLRESLRRRSSKPDFKSKFAEIAAMTPKGVAQTDSVEMLRELRNR